MSSLQSVRTPGVELGTSGLGTGPEASIAAIAAISFDLFRSDLSGLHLA